jgi:hypothetical protein
VSRVGAIETRGAGLSVREVPVIDLTPVRLALILGGIAGAVFVLTMFFMGGCALHNPPPCDPSQWPDPCYGITETVADAGSDG